MPEMELTRLVPRFSSQFDFQAELDFSFFLLFVCEGMMLSGLTFLEMVFLTILDNFDNDNDNKTCRL